MTLVMLFVVGNKTTYVIFYVDSETFIYSYHFKMVKFNTEKKIIKQKCYNEV